MRYLNKHRYSRIGEHAEDPLSGVANLFDASIVFIVAMMLALFSAWNMMDLLDPNSEVTIAKKTADGRVEVLTKKGAEIKVSKVSDQPLSGAGKRLGTAYQLPDGKVIYVPE
ncbi:DUF2149 domain-containing protein [Duganella sp. PWIR1]|jgi:hypothetical protein|uniref:DUF2149 domain-containing protein n=1 Tax=Duganella sp. BuS-21 TaxID=2943848 RepID=UPI0035A74410